MDTSFDFDTRTASTILCCLCGVNIEPNPAGMCVNCIRSQVDITEGIPKQVVIYWCRGCGRYLSPPNQWVMAALESRELLTLCVKRLKGLSHVKLVDAGFVWTEPHSKRLKVKLTIQKEVMASTILQQVFVVEYVVSNQHCDSCHRVQAENTWQTIVQLRQKTDHKRTFFWLEQLILKHGAHQKVVNVKQRPDGLDFYFLQRNEAVKLVDFLQQVVPLRSKASERLISRDIRSNTSTMKFTIACEIPSPCKSDLVVLPKRIANRNGNINPLVVVHKVSSVIHVIDPLSLQTADVYNQAFWDTPFVSLCTITSAVEYIVLDVQLTGVTQGRYALADIQVARLSDFGRNDQTFITRTHLGNILNPGDTCRGYDLARAQFNDDNLDQLLRRGFEMPDVVIVSKTYPRHRKRIRVRHWRLERMEAEEDAEYERKKALRAREARDQEIFLRDLEEDPEMRQQVNLYATNDAENVYTQRQHEIEASRATLDPDEEVEEDFPEIQLDELLASLTLDEQAAAAALVGPFTDDGSVEASGGGDEAGDVVDSDDDADMGL